ncbi:hypothetical protein LTR94_034459, partial [Friedmanniomyces endolithicus]
MGGRMRSHHVDLQPAIGFPGEAAREIFAVLVIIEVAALHADDVRRTIPVGVGCGTDVDGVKRGGEAGDDMVPVDRRSAQLDPATRRATARAGCQLRIEIEALDAAQIDRI